ncbi:DUF5615 family PIN-like protein [Candidatus Daviesbacteria bacterium]|nr:DUF5615 family PIN-like protein [Candidatus Daviesbacteria bacterium]
MTKSAKRFYKHKLLLDENFPVRSYFPNLNKRHDIKHLTKDLNLASLSDIKVYKLAQKEKRVVVTYNVKDFVPLMANDTKSGIIGVSPSLLPEQADKKLTALLNKSTKKSLFGKLTTLTEEGN